MNKTNKGKHKCIKTGLMYINKGFEIDKQAGIVKCNLYFSLLGRKNNPIFKINNKETLLNICPEFRRTTFPYFESTGVARCSNGDVFDEEFGKRLALTRAQDKAFRIASNIYAKLYHHIGYLSNELYWYANNSLICASESQEHARELINENDNKK